MSKYPTLNHLKSSVVSLVSYINSLFIPLADAVEELSKAVEGNAGSVDFDNKISWPGCTFTTNPKNSAEEIIQTITDTASGKLKAKKVTLDSGNYTYTETYIFYADDGATVKEKYTVQITRDSSKVWTEVVKKVV